MTNIARKKDLSASYLTATDKDQTATDRTALSTEILSAFCKAAGDPLRLEILRVLRHNAYGVLELSELFEVKQSGMSHHLKVLSKAELVTTRREGNTIFYRRLPSPANSQLLELHRSLFATVDQLTLSAQLQHRIDETNQARTKASQDFFQQNAEKFQANQDLIASYGQYGDIVTEFLDATACSKKTVLEVGPGEGDFLPSLSQRFEHVFALDNSDEMLNRSHGIVHENNLTNVTLIHGDTNVALTQEIKADCITLNMVLHHIPNPSHIFEDLKQLLAKDGALLVTDLCHHDQSWARESCGDLWLGFEPEDISLWASTAGFIEGESLYLAQRNGFQIQLRQFFNNSEH